jgi:hypothetical protein
MQSLVESNSLEKTLQEVVSHILNSGRITGAERLWFHQLILTDVMLAPGMLQQIRQIFDRLQMGLIKVVD